MFGKGAAMSTPSDFLREVAEFCQSRRRKASAALVMLTSGTAAPDESREGSTRTASAPAEKCGDGQRASQSPVTLRLVQGRFQSPARLHQPALRRAYGTHPALQEGNPIRVRWSR